MEGRAMSDNERTTTSERCAVCGKKLVRGERRACRACVVAVATMRAAKKPGGHGGFAEDGR